DQVYDEIHAVSSLILELYRTFGFEKVGIYLSTRPEKALGASSVWEKAEAMLRKALDDQKLDYRVDDKGGSFYGPKIDFLVTDALGREWQLGTNQLDFQLPERFDLKYTTKEGGEDRPVMIHRAMFGSLERFIGVMIEHFGGALPLWLAPVQVALLP